MGCTEGAAKAEVDGGADEPTEPPIDVALACQREGTRGELIMRQPAAGGLGKRRRTRLQMLLIERLRVGHKRLEVKGRELLRGKG